MAGGYRYQTAAPLAPYVERFLLHDQRARLSGAALETLAIIAYKQPVTRIEIEEIRFDEDFDEGIFNKRNLTRKD